MQNSGSNIMSQILTYFVDIVKPVTKFWTEYVINFAICEYSQVNCKVQKRRELALIYESGI